MSRKRVFSVELPGSVVDEFNKFTESTGCLKYRLVQAGMWLMRVCPPDLRDALMREDEGFAQVIRRAEANAEFIRAIGLDGDHGLTTKEIREAIDGALDKKAAVQR